MLRVVILITNILSIDLFSNFRKRDKKTPANNHKWWPEKIGVGERLEELVGMIHNYILQLEKYKLGYMMMII